jgi:regulator of nonsense transcripts 3
MQLYANMLIFFQVVIRGLPPTMTQDTFIEQISPLPDNDYLYFVRADLSLGQFAFSRAYINFLNPEDIFIFTEKFDGYVFVDQKGNWQKKKKFFFCFVFLFCLFVRFFFFFENEMQYNWFLCAGNEYSAMVEFAPFPKIPKRVCRKKDAKRGTIETDPDYLRFLELREKATETDSGPPSTQEVLEEIEAKEREMRGT